MQFESALMQKSHAYNFKKGPVMQIRGVEGSCHFYGCYNDTRPVYTIGVFFIFLQAHCREKIHINLQSNTDLKTTLCSSQYVSQQTEKISSRNSNDPLERQLFMKRKQILVNGILEIHFKGQQTDRRVPWRMSLLRFNPSSDLIYRCTDSKLFDVACKKSRLKCW